LPAVAAVEFLGGEAVGTAVGAEPSSRGAQLSPDAFEPIPLEEVQDHFRPETGERLQPGALPVRDRPQPRPLPARDRSQPRPLSARDRSQTRPLPARDR
jgi:hypothetical protein